MAKNNDYTNIHYNFIDEINTCAWCDNGYHRKQVDLANIFSADRTLEIDMSLYELIKNITLYDSDMYSSLHFCELNACTCKFGYPAVGTACPIHDSEKCSSCFLGFELKSGRCVIDIRGPGSNRDNHDNRDYLRFVPFFINFSQKNHEIY